MRASPRSQQQDENIRTVRRDRRRLSVVLIGVAGLSVASAWLAIAVRPPGFIDMNLGAFALVTGPSGSATGTAISDSSLVTDGGTFASAGEMVSVRFGSGSEARGIVRAVRTTAEALPVAVVVLPDGAITPASLITAGYEGSRAVVVCVGDDGVVHHDRLELPGELDELPAVVAACGPGAALVADAEGHDLLGLVVTGRGGRLRVAPLERVQLP